jgi:nucleoside-diphosphate-sugar epimerase
MPNKIKPFIKFFIDIFLALIAVIISYYFLYDFNFIVQNFSDILFQFSLFSFCYLAASLVIKNYNSIWEYASLDELFKLGITIILSFILVSIAALIANFDINNKSLVLFYLLFSFFIALTRLLRRYISERKNLFKGNKKTIIVGVNSNTNDFLKNPNNRFAYDIVGIFDDYYDQGKTIYGYKVIGHTLDISAFIKKSDIEVVIYTGIFDNDPLLKKNFIRRIVNNSVVLLTFDDNLKKEIPLTLSSMDKVKEIESTLLPKVSKDREKNILVTGGAGYIGIHLVKLLLDDNYNVTILDNFTFGKEPIKDIKDHPNLTIIHGEITNIKDLVRAVKNNRFVIALAAIVGDPASSIDAEETLNLNYESTKVLTQICNFYEVEKLVFASSCSVYGSSGSTFLTENSPLNPISLYARTRIYSENYILDQSRGVSPTIMRLSTVFGYSPRMRYDLVVNTLLIRALRDNKFSVFGGDQWRPFVHCYDVARAFKLAIEADKNITHNQIFNVGSDDMNFTIDNIGEKVAKKLPKSNMKIVEEDVDKRNYKVSFSKISNSLGFQKKYTIEMGLDEMIKEAQKDDQLLKYEDKLYSNFIHLKDSYEKQ